MKKRTELMVIPMIGIGFSRQSLNFQGIWINITKINFLFLEYSIYRY
jgi:hypothetical protein